MFCFQGPTLPANSSGPGEVWPKGCEAGCGCLKCIERGVPLSPKLAEAVAWWWWECLRKSGGLSELLAPPNSVLSVFPCLNGHNLRSNLSTRKNSHRQLLGKPIFCRFNLQNPTETWWVMFIWRFPKIPSSHPNSWSFCSKPMGPTTKFSAYQNMSPPRSPSDGQTRKKIPSGQHTTMGNHRFCEVNINHEYGHGFNSKLLYSLREGNINIHNGIDILDLFPGFLSC